jgi:hypothetical protein
MGNSEVTRLVGADWGAESKVIHCQTDILPMTLDWLAAGVDAGFIGRAQDRCGYTVRYFVPPEFAAAAVAPLTDFVIGSEAR